MFQILNRQQIQQNMGRYGNMSEDQYQYQPSNPKDGSDACQIVSADDATQIAYECADQYYQQIDEENEEGPIDYEMERIDQVEGEEQEESECQYDQDDDDQMDDQSNTQPMSKEEFDQMLKGKMAQVNYQQQMYQNNPMMNYQQPLIDMNLAKQNYLRIREKLSCNNQHQYTMPMPQQQKNQEYVTESADIKNHYNLESFSNFSPNAISHDTGAPITNLNQQPRLLSTVNTFQTLRSHPKHSQPTQHQLVTNSVYTNPNYNYKNELMYHQQINSNAPSGKVADLLNPNKQWKKKKRSRSYVISNGVMIHKSQERLKKKQLLSQRIVMMSAQQRKDKLLSELQECRKHIMLLKLEMHDVYDDIDREQYKIYKAQTREIRSRSKIDHQINNMIFPKPPLAASKSLANYNRSISGVSGGTISHQHISNTLQSYGSSRQTFTFAGNSSIGASKRKNNNIQWHKKVQRKENIMDEIERIDRGVREIMQNQGQEASHGQGQFAQHRLQSANPQLCKGRFQTLNQLNIQYQDTANVETANSSRVQNSNGKLTKKTGRLSRVDSNFDQQIWDPVSDGFNLLKQSNSITHFNNSPNSKEHKFSFGGREEPCVKDLKKWKALMHTLQLKLIKKQEKTSRLMKKMGSQIINVPSSANASNDFSREESATFDPKAVLARASILYSKMKVATVHLQDEKLRFEAQNQYSKAESIHNINTNPSACSQITHTVNTNRVLNQKKPSMSMGYRQSLNAIQTATTFDDKQVKKTEVVNPPTLGPKEDSMAVGKCQSISPVTNTLKTQKQSSSKDIIKQNEANERFKNIEFESIDKQNTNMFDCQFVETNMTNQKTMTPQIHCSVQENPNADIICETENDDQPDGVGSKIKTMETGRMSELDKLIVQMKSMEQQLISRTSRVLQQTDVIREIKMIHNNHLKQEQMYTTTQSQSVTADRPPMKMRHKSARIQIKKNQPNAPCPFGTFNSGTLQTQNYMEMQNKPIIPRGTSANRQNRATNKYQSLKSKNTHRTQRLNKMTGSLIYNNQNERMAFVKF